jgi:serine/threonine protein kinase
MFQGRFSQLKTVGAGAMGKIYKAWDEAGSRHVALKVLEARDTSKRFEREARVLSQLDHPNIVRYVGHGVTAEGQPWLAMEWLEGADLESRLKKGPLDYTDTLRVARAVAGGLAWAHEQGFIHRDLKPSNVFVVGGDLRHVKIVDFGLARGDILEAPITKTGTLMGTIEYMPPEQVNDAKRADARADVYSLGAVLFHCITGRAPHQGPTMVATMKKTLTEEAPPMSAFQPDVPVAFEALVASMLRKDRDQRPANGAAVFAALAGLEAGDRSDFASAPVDVDAPTVMSDRFASAAPPSSRRPVNVSPKTGTVIIPVQPLPSPQRPASVPLPEPPPPPIAVRAAPAGTKGAWIGTGLFGLLVLLALAFATWRSLGRR